MKPRQLGFIWVNLHHLWKGRIWTSGAAVSYESLRTLWVGALECSAFTRTGTQGHMRHESHSEEECELHAQPGKCPGYPETWKGTDREWIAGYVGEKGDGGKGRKGGLNLVASVRDSNITKEDVLGSLAC